MPYNNAFIDPGYSAAAAPSSVAPSDYQQKKLLAEALRRKAERFSTMQGNDPVSVTRGARGMPDIAQVNYGGILSNALGGYMGAKKTEEAAQADEDVKATKSAALSKLLGTGKDLTPAQMAQFGSEYDAPELQTAALRQMMPQRMNSAAVAQAASSPAGIRALVQMGVWSKDQGDASLAELNSERDAAHQQSRDDYLFEQQNKALSPKTGLTFEQQMALARARGVTGGDPLAKETAKQDAKIYGAQVTKGQAAAQGRSQLQQLSNSLDSAESDMKKNRVLSAADQVYHKIPGMPDALSPRTFNPAMSGVYQQAKQLQATAIQTFRAPGSVSDYESKALAATSVNGDESPEVMRQKMRNLDNLYQYGESQGAVADFKMHHHGMTPSQFAEAYPEDAQNDPNIQRGALHEQNIKRLEASQAQDLKGIEPGPVKKEPAKSNGGWSVTVKP